MKGFCLGIYRFGVIANVSMLVLIALAILIKQPATATPGAVFAAVAIVTACTLLPGIILSFVFTGKTPWQLLGKTPFLFRWVKQ